MPPPRRPNFAIGPRAPRVRRLEEILDAVQAIERTAREYADAIHGIRPCTITAESFADLQGLVEDWYESQRKAAQLLYDLAETIAREGDAVSRAAELMAARKRTGPPVIDDPRIFAD